MREINPVGAIIAELLILGIEKVSWRHINKVAAEFKAILPRDYYINMKPCFDYDDRLIYQPNSRENEESCDIFVLGWCNKPQAQILEILKNYLRSSPFRDVLVEKLNELDLEKIHRQIFTQEYVDKHYLREIPDAYRDKFVKICQRFASYKANKIL